jgi:hypothetical protein
LDPLKMLLSGPNVIFLHGTLLNRNPKCLQFKMNMCKVSSVFSQTKASRVVEYEELKSNQCSQYLIIVVTIMKRNGLLGKGLTNSVVFSYVLQTSVPFSEIVQHLNHPSLQRLRIGVHDHRHVPDNSALYDNAKIIEEGL